MNNAHILIFSGAISLAVSLAVSLGVNQTPSQSPPEKANATNTECVWSGTGVAGCFSGNIDKVPCDYAHPSEFSDEDWLRFAQRCRHRDADAYHSPDHEQKSECSARLAIAAAYDRSGYIRANMDEIVAQQCRG